MATPEELRERLRAKRDAQIQQAHQREEVNAQARQAVQDLIILGYNFADILHLTKGKVTAEHLDTHYKAIGYYRRRNDLPAEGPQRVQESFGSPRWLSNVNNFTINLEDSEPESASEEEDEESQRRDVLQMHGLLTQNPQLKDGSVGHTLSAYEPSETGRAEDGDVLNTPYPPKDAILSNPAFPQGTTEISSASLVSAQNSDPSDTPYQHSRGNEPSTETLASRPAPSFLKSENEAPSDDQALDSSHVSDAESIDMTAESDHHPLTSQMHNERTEDVPMKNAPVSSSPGFEQSESGPHTPDGQAGLDHQDLPAVSPRLLIGSPAPRDSTQPDPQASHQNTKAGSSQTPASGDFQDAQDTRPTQAGDSEMDTSSEDEAPPLEESIQEELRKVQEQIRAVQQRKLAKENQREAESAMQKRTAELSGIAAKRAILTQTRHRLNMRKLTSRVSKLEARLKHAREAVLSAAVQLKDINAQSMELEKKEIQIREELAQPASKTSSGMIVEDNADEEAEFATPAVSTAEDVVMDKVPVKVLTAHDSPLRMFSSWRLAPLGTRHWFSPSFNGRFVKDLDVREFCNVDLGGESCVDRDCEFVHYQDFEVQPQLIVKYMATRGIERPGFREGLVEAMRTHFAGPDASVEQLAAAVVGFRQQYDSTQVLDWDSWKVPRPL